MRVAFCTPTGTRPHDAYLDALERSVPHLDGYEHATCFTVGSVYISWARMDALGKALRWGADQVVFIDHDVSWRPEDLKKLLETPGDVVGGTYRFKIPEHIYMGRPMIGEKGAPLVRDDGCILMQYLPAGFLRVSRAAIEKFMAAYPHLVIQEKGEPNVDLFNHGVHQGVWFGEDYAFSRNWRDLGGELWCIPDLNLDHHGKDKVWPGNYHQWLLRGKEANESEFAARAKREEEWRKAA